MISRAFHMLKEARVCQLGHEPRPLQAPKKLAGFPRLRLFFLRGTPAGLFQVTRGDPLEARNVAGVQSNFQSTYTVVFVLAVAHSWDLLAHTPSARALAILSIVIPW
jgi:hypothetical protein